MHVYIYISIYIHMYIYIYIYIYEACKFIRDLLKYRTFLPHRRSVFVPRDLHLYHTNACWKQVFVFASLPHKFAAESLSFEAVD